jgi:hypothetical protein
MIRIGALALLSLSLAWSPGDDDVDPEIYRRALETALTRAQAQLENSFSLWEDHSTWENPWREASRYYEVTTTESRFAALDIAEGLDGMLGHFQTVLGTRYAPAQPFQVYVLPDVAGYNDFGEEHGEEHSSLYASFYAEGHPQSPVATIQSGNGTLLRMWITHGAVHQFLDRAYSGEPAPWLEEGLASYFATYWAYPWCVEQLQQIVADGRFVPLRQLLTEPLAQYAEDADARFIELGMLFNYLLHLREDSRSYEEDGVTVPGPFAEYIRVTLAGQDSTGMAAYQLLTGRLDEIEAELKRPETWQ